MTGRDLNRIMTLYSLDMLVKELAKSALDLAEWVKEASSREEWKEEKEKEQESKRSVQEERWLWKRLEESDREQAKEER